MLYTNLKHIETAAYLNKLIDEYENVVIICGRMEPVSIHVFRIAEELEKQFPHVRFFDMEFDNPETMILKNTLEYYNLSQIPIIGFYKMGDLRNVLWGMQTRQSFIHILEEEFNFKSEEINSK